jgi:hypothetical protein
MWIKNGRVDRKKRKQGKDRMQERRKQGKIKSLFIILFYEAAGPINVTCSGRDLFQSVMPVVDMRN